MRITGRDAIIYSEHHSATLRCSSDPEGEWHPVTLARALRIAEIAPTLIYCRCPPGTRAWGPTRPNVLWVSDVGGGDGNIWPVFATPTVFATSAQEATERARAELRSLGHKGFVVCAESADASDVGCSQ